MSSLIMHMLVTGVWAFLNGTPTIGGFFIGGVASFILLWAFQKVLKCEDYVRRVLAGLAFAAFFLKDVVVSNVSMAKLCLKPGINEQEGSFSQYKVSDLTPTETVLLAYLINLTPGTTVADRTKDGHFVLHSFPCVDADVLEQKINETLKCRLLAITR